MLLFLLGLSLTILVGLFGSWLSHAEDRRIERLLQAWEQECLRGHYLSGLYGTEAYDEIIRLVFAAISNPTRANTDAALKAIEGVRS